MGHRRIGIASFSAAVALLAAGLLLSPAVQAGVARPSLEQAAPTPTPVETASSIGVFGRRRSAGQLPHGSPRVAAPTLRSGWEDTDRVLQVCLYGFRENAEVTVSAQNPTGEIFSAPFTVGPPVESSDEQGEYAVTVVEANLLWPGAAPGGSWRIFVTADGNVYEESHEIPPVAPAEGIHLMVTPRDFRNPLRLSFPGTATCYLEYAYYRGDQLTISGSGYPANVDAEVGLYRAWVAENAQYAAERIGHFPIRTDNRGGFALAYRIPQVPRSACIGRLR